MLLNSPNARDGLHYKQATSQRQVGDHTVEFRAELAQANANVSSLVGCVRINCHQSHTNYVSDESLFLMSVSSNMYSKDNGTSAVTVPAASGLLLLVCQAEPPVLLQP